MLPLIRRLQETFTELPLIEVGQNPLNWTFTARIKQLGPDFYKKAIPLHLVMNLEYSLLCQQIRSKFLSGRLLAQDEIVEQLIAALMLAELLEHIYQHYLIVPREVTRLRKQQILYRELLAGIVAPLPLNATKKVDESASLSQEIRNRTININLYRLLFIRSKRTLDLIAILNSSSEAYCKFVKNLDNVAAPVLVHLAWFFYLPRLLVNLFLVIKHTVPHAWMSEEEKSLGWSVRFQAQMKRRWFELGNDIAWVSVGLINCFILTGVLAPVGAYLSIACFGFDILMSLTRTYIELNRLYELEKHYLTMQSQATTRQEQKQIKEYLKTIENQIDFERLRLGSHVTTTTTVFFAMCCSAPLFAANPVIPLLAAIVLVSLCLLNFALVQIINERRPKDTIEAPSGLAKLGFFSKKEPELIELLSESQQNIELDKLVYS
jgi:hypothetical protein